MTTRSLTRALFALAVVVAGAGCAAPGPELSPTISAPRTPSPPPTTTPQPTDTLAPTVTPVPTPTPLTTISQETDLGTVTLDIPSPLLPAGVEVSIEARGEEEAPRDIRDAGARQPFHVLLPQDLSFAEPITVTVAMPVRKFTRPDGSIAIAFLAIRSSDGTWQWLDAAAVSIVGETVTLRGTTTHFGALFAWSDRTDLLRIPQELGAHFVGETFRPLVGLSPREPRDHPVAFAAPPDYVNRDLTVVEVGPPLTTITYRDWRCLAVGNYTVTFGGQLTSFGVDNPFFGVTLDVPPTSGALAYDMTGSCLERPPPSPTPPPPTPTLPASPNSSPSSSP